MKNTITLSGGDYSVDWSFKLGPWTINLPKETGTLSGKTFSFANTLNYNENIKLSSKAVLVIDLNKTALFVEVRVFGTHVWASTYDLVKIIDAKGLELPGYSGHGITITPLKLVLS